MNSNETETPPPTSSPPPPAKPPQKPLTRQAKWQLGISLFITASVVAHCAPPGKYGKPAMNITGIVYDQNTKLPIEGAYVMAVYREMGGSFAGTAIWCVKTKGMYTGKDGSYHFPVEKMDGVSPDEVFAIKPDYYWHDSVLPTEFQNRWKSFGIYSNRHVYLKRQDPAKPSFRHGASYCERPKSNEDVEANIVFFKIELTEHLKHGGSEAGERSQRNLIRSMETAVSPKLFSH